MQNKDVVWINPIAMLTYRPPAERNYCEHDAWQICRECKTAGK